jgi:replication factor C large subunit
MGWDLVEMNASDKRAFDIIKQVAGTAADTGTLFSGARGKRLVVLDEVDNVYGVADRGGYRAIEELIKDPRNPVVLIANDQYEIPWQIRAACLMINFRRVQQEAIVRTLQKICRAEKIDAEPVVLKVIAETSNGDLRSAINDLQAIAEGKKHLAMKDVVLYKRDREANIFDVLSQLMRATTAKQARELLWSLDMPPEDVLAWIDENIPRVLADPADLAEAYEAIARADIFLGRTRRRQAYGMWRYVSDMMTAGVAMSKRGELKYVRFQMPSAITKMSRTRAARATRDSVARKIAGHCHTSSRVARKDFLPYLGVIFRRDKSTAKRIAAELDFSEGEVDYLVKT